MQTNKYVENVMRLFLLKSFYHDDEEGTYLIGMHCI